MITELFRKFVNGDIEAPKGDRFGELTERTELTPKQESRLSVRECFKNAPTVVPDHSNYFLLPHNGKLVRVMN